MRMNALLYVVAPSHRADLNDVRRNCELATTRDETPEAAARLSCTSIVGTIGAASRSVT